MYGILRALSDELIKSMAASGKPVHGWRASMEGMKAKAFLSSVPEAREPPNLRGRRCSGDWRSSSARINSSQRKKSLCSAGWARRGCGACAPTSPRKAPVRATLFSLKRPTTPQARPMWASMWAITGCSTAATCAQKGESRSRRKGEMKFFKALPRR